MKDAKIEILKHLGFNPVFYSSEINNNKIDLDVFENMFILRQDKGINMIFNSVMNYSDEILNGMINISTNIEARNAFKKLCGVLKSNNSYDTDGEEIFELFSNIRFAKYINLIDKFEKRVSIYNLKRNFNIDTKIPNFYENPTIFKKYMSDPEKSFYKMDDINKYYDVRDDHFIKLINNNDEQIKEKIIGSYFGLSIKEYNELIKKVINTNIIKDKKKFEYIISFNNGNLIEYIKNIREFENYFKCLENSIVEYSKCDLSKNIIIPKTDKQIKEFTNEDFNMLVHKIAGMIKDNEFLKKNIKEWDKHYDESGTISCSLISDSYIATVNGDHLILGFSNILPSDIIAMNTHDMHFEKQDINNKSVSNFMPTNMLLENSSFYNEVVLKRYRDKNAIMPDYVLALDKIQDRDLSASTDLNIPIYLIKLEKYADKLIDKLNYLKENDYEKYLLYLNRFIRQVSSLNIIMKDYYNKILYSEAVKSNNDNINEDIEKIKKMMK